QNNQPAEAIPWAKKAATLSIQHASSLKLAAAYQTLADAYEKMGDDKNASGYLKKLLLHKDSLADDHYNQAMAEMQVQFDTQKKTAENLELKKVNLESTLKNSQQQRWLLILVGGLVLLLASAIYTYFFIKGRYKIRLAMEQLNEQKKRSMAVMEAEEKERKRIAADLHDGVCQTLAAASLQLKKARKEPLQFDKVDDLINQAGTEVRNLSHQVTPELLLHYGLVKAMEQAIDRLNDSGDQTVFTLFNHIEKDIEGEMPSLMIYRCFQELTNNILKHAKASQVNVQLNLHEEEIQLMVEDDGVGFAANNDCAGIGLKNIESRVAIYNGVFIMDSMPGKGSTAIIKCSRPMLLNGLNKTI
ncbi:MAG TPA: histidine kinase, partial [Ferruginibacter sp.]|nr:histidine kinase [Ferruginibacter sp.]